MTQHQALMHEALQEAALARDGGNWAVGCVITLDGKIVARGRNFVFSERNRLLHAELDAIAKLQIDHFDSRDKNLVLYTTLEPCPMCFGAILLAGIRTIVSGTNLDNSGASSSMSNIPEFFRQPHFKTTMITGILAKECEDMWLSGQPAKPILKRDVRINYSSSNRIRIYSTPVTGPRNHLDKGISDSHQNSTGFRLRSIFSFTK